MVRRKSEVGLKRLSQKLVAVAAKKRLFNKDNSFTQPVDSSITSETALEINKKDMKKPKKRHGSSKKPKRIFTPNKSIRCSAMDVTYPRNKPGALALKQIHRLQRSTNLLIPRLPFTRLVKEILMGLSRHQTEPLRIQSLALEALQEFTELHMAHFFEDSVLCAIHARRVTLKPQDLQLARRIRGRSDPIND